MNIDNAVSLLMFNSDASMSEKHCAFYLGKDFGIF